MRVVGDRPIFVVGCGRSGTTVLYEVLCEHPRLAWFSNYSDRFPGRSAVALLHRARWLGRPPKGSGRSRWRPHPVEGYATWDHCTGALPGGANRPLGAADLTAEAAARARSAVHGHVRAQGADELINKNTRNARRIPYLAAAFPEARFVHVLRHPASVARSLTRVAFWPDMPVWWAGDAPAGSLERPDHPALAVASAFWARELEVVRRDRAEVAAERFVDVRYEDLVADPASTVDGLVSALGLEPSPAVDAAVRERLAVDRADRPDRPGSGLSAGELDLVWSQAGAEAGRWGYFPT